MKRKVMISSLLIVVYGLVMPLGAVVWGGLFSGTRFLTQGRNFIPLSDGVSVVRACMQNTTINCALASVAKVQRIRAGSQCVITISLQQDGLLMHYGQALVGLSSVRVLTKSVVPGNREYVWKKLGELKLYDRVLNAADPSKSLIVSRILAEQSSINPVPLAVCEMQDDNPAGLVVCVGDASVYVKPCPGFYMHDGSMQLIDVE